MKQFLYAYAIALSICLTLDILWYAGIAKNFYHRELGDILAPEVNILIIGVHYIIFITGIVVFVIMPALREKSSFRALVLGLLFGLSVCVAYDLVNLATIKNWSALVSVVDIAWNTILGGAIAFLTYHIMVRFF